MGNHVLDQMMSRFSVRAFTDEKIKPEVLEQILAATQQAPNSINGQQISLIVVQDKERLAQLADICFGQPHIRDAAAFILVVADFNRVRTAIEMEGKTMGATDSVEGLVTGAVDAGITVQALETAAGSFGVRSTVIGALRGNMEAIIEFFGLPIHSIPMVGLTMGYPDEAKLSRVKPRINMEAYAFAEKYPENFDFKPYFEEYAKTFAEFAESVGLNETYGGKTSASYSTDSAQRNTAPIYEKQGFKLK